MGASPGCNARPCTPRRVVLEPCALSIRQMTLRLSRVLGRSAESWLAMQDSHDLWQARQRLDLSGLTLMELTTA